MRRVSSAAFVFALFALSALVSTHAYVSGGPDLIGMRFDIYEENLVPKGGSIFKLTQSGAGATVTLPNGEEFDDYEEIIYDRSGLPSMKCYASTHTYDSFSKVVKSYDSHLGITAELSLSGKDGDLSLSGAFERSKHRFDGWTQNQTSVAMLSNCTLQEYRFALDGLMAYTSGLTPSVSRALGTLPKKNCYAKDASCKMKYCMMRELLGSYVVSSATFGGVAHVGVSMDKNAYNQWDQSWTSTQVKLALEYQKDQLGIEHNSNASLSHLNPKFRHNMNLVNSSVGGRAGVLENQGMHKWTSTVKKTPTMLLTHSKLKPITHFMWFSDLGMTVEKQFNRAIVDHIKCKGCSCRSSFAKHKGLQGDSLMQEMGEYEAMVREILGEEGE